MTTGHVSENDPFIDYLKFKTRPSSLRNSEMAYDSVRTDVFQWHWRSPSRLWPEVKVAPKNRWKA